MHVAPKYCPAHLVRKCLVILKISKVDHPSTGQVLGRRRKEMLLEEYTGVPDAGDGGAPPQPKWAMQVPALPGCPHCMT